MTNLDNDMRDWLISCFSDDYDQEQIQELSRAELVQAINRYYDGGLRAFIACNGWQMVEGCNECNK